MKIDKKKEMEEQLNCSFTLTKMIISLSIKLSALFPSPYSLNNFLD